MCGCVRCASRPHASYVAGVGTQQQPTPSGCGVPLLFCCAQVKAKDVKLKQLRGAIKALEEKLAQLLKDKVDM